MPVDESKLLFLPLEVATTALPGESHHISNAWWAVHPEKGLVLYRRTPRGRYCSPQYNTDRRVTQQLIKTLYPFAEARQIEHVYLRYDSENGYFIPKEITPA